jgi:hypothetical protein
MLYYQNKMEKLNIYLLMLNVQTQMLNKDNIIKIITLINTMINSTHSIGMIQSYNPFVRLCDRIQHVIIMDLELVCVYSNIN